MKIINVLDASKGLKEKKAVLLDVRTPSEYETIHARGAINVPLDKIDDVKSIIKNSKKDVYVICKSGQRSQMACSKLLSVRSENLYSVDGGTLSWVQHNLSTVSGKKRWDLERQVRFVAGLLVLLGVLLGVYVNNLFYILSGLVGAGLVFASVTNTCMMGMLLSKLPYNKSGDFSEDKLKQVLK